jgi:hypothetical protein
VLVPLPRSSTDWSIGRIDSVDAEVCLINRIQHQGLSITTRIAFGFRSPDALVALDRLNLGGHHPGFSLAGRDPWTQGAGKVVRTMLRGGRRTGVTGYCWGLEPGNAPHRRQAGGGWSRSTARR